jgi:hypothetical protein
VCLYKNDTECPDWDPSCSSSVTEGKCRYSV